MPRLLDAIVAGGSDGAAEAVDVALDADPLGLQQLDETPIRFGGGLLEAPQGGKCFPGSSTLGMQSADELRDPGAQALASDERRIQGIEVSPAEGRRAVLALALPAPESPLELDFGPRGACFGKSNAVDQVPRNHWLTG